MRTELLSVLRCPRRKADRSLHWSVREEIAGEVREGEPTRRGRGEWRAIAGGIVDPLVGAPDFGAGT